MCAPFTSERRSHAPPRGADHAGASPAPSPPRPPWLPSSPPAAAGPPAPRPPRTRPWCSSASRRSRPGPVERPIRAAGTVAAKNEWDLSFKVGGRPRAPSGWTRARPSGRPGAGASSTRPSSRPGSTQAREGLAKAQRDAERATLLAAAGRGAARAAEDAAHRRPPSRRPRSPPAEFNLRHARLVAPDDGWVDRPHGRAGRGGRAGQTRAAPLRQGPRVRRPRRRRGARRARAGPRRARDGHARRAPRRRPAGPGDRDRPRGGAGHGHVAGGDPDRPRPARRPLLAGLTAKVQIPRSVPAAGAVPLAAVVAGDGAAGAVFAVEDGRARRVPVPIAFLDGDRAVLAGRASSTSRPSSPTAPPGSPTAPASASRPEGARHARRRILRPPLAVHARPLPRPRPPGRRLAPRHPEGRGSHLPVPELRDRGGPARRDPGRPRAARRRSASRPASRRSRT